MFDIALDAPGFQYQTQVCVKKFLGFCSKKEPKREIFDFTDPAVRKQFNDMGFKLMRERD